jgi:alpha-amylase/alpha-mannosidase (GH57 family)
VRVARYTLAHMASVCFYFQVHQPFRLRRYSVFDTDPFYFDNDANQAICEKVAEKCYRPATRKILDLIKRHEGRFRVSYSISGTALEQFKLWTPDVIEMFQELAASGGAWGFFTCGPPPGGSRPSPGSSPRNRRRRFDA